MEQETEVKQYTPEEMAASGMDMVEEMLDDLIDPMEDVELSGAARERVEWARHELWHRLGWLTCSMPAGYPNALAKLAGDESEEGVDTSAFEEWLSEALRILADGRYLRNVVRRERLLAQGYEVPEEIKAPCHHQEEKEAAVVH